MQVLVLHNNFWPRFACTGQVSVRLNRFPGSRSASSSSNGHACPTHQQLLFSVCFKCYDFSPNLLTKLALP